MNSIRQKRLAEEHKAFRRLVQRGMELWKWPADQWCGDCDGYGCTGPCKWHDWHRDAKNLVDKSFGRGR